MVSRKNPTATICFARRASFSSSTCCRERRSDGLFRFVIGENVVQHVSVIGSERRHRGISRGGFSSHSDS
jgi:hypothetical protein